MDRLGYNNSISRFLRMKGRSRLGVENDLTEKLLEQGFPEITFLETKHMETEYGEWDEFYILTQVKKIETPEYFRYITFQIDLIMKTLRRFGVKDCGIQEFDSSDNKYNILIYVLTNGREKETCKENEYEELLRDYQQ